MNSQDEMRHWIRRKLEARGYGAKKRLADFLGLKPDQITRILRLDAGKEVRAIKADEWQKIQRFFAPQPGEPAAAARAALAQTYDMLSAERQKMLTEFAEFLRRQQEKSGENA